MNAQHPPQPAAPAPVAPQPAAVSAPAQVAPAAPAAPAPFALNEAELRIRDLNARNVALEARVAQLEPAARLANEMQAELTSSPQAFAERAARMARIAEGSATAEDQAAIAKGHAPQTVQVLNEMRAEMAELRTNRAVADVQTEINRHELFKNDPDARALAETLLGTMRVQFANVPLRDLGDAVAKQINAIASKGAAQSFQTRTQNLQTLPPVPAGQTPGMTSPEPPPTMADLKNGGLRRRMSAFLAGPHGIAQ